MFSLFPIQRPRIGISFRAHALDLVEVRRGWSRVPTVTRLMTRPLPSGWLTPTATTPHISDPAALSKELHTFLEGVHDRAVAIDLPMTSGTLALVHLETFPTVRAEQDALLRWRLRQEEHLTNPDLTLLWQVFPATRPGSTSISVLVVAIRQNILDQYRQVCDNADLLPVSIGFSTLHLLDLARSAILGTEEELYVAHRSAETLIILAFSQGQPVGLRVKPIRRAGIDLKTELIQTLRYFEQGTPQPKTTTSRTTPIYMVEEGAAVSPSAPDMTEVWTLSDEPLWTVPVHQVRWAMAPIVSTLPVPEYPPFAALGSVLAS